MKPIVGVDMDDVLIDFNIGIHKFYNSRVGTSFTREDMHTFDFEKTWGCSTEEAVQIVFEFISSKEHAMLPPVFGSQEALTHLKNKYDFIVVTARPESVKKETLQWLTLHFPNIFNDVIFTGAYGATEKKRSKGEIAHELGMVGFIEDALHNAISITGYNIPVYLLDAPWNQGDIPQRVKRYYSWKEIVDVL